MVPLLLTMGSLSLGQTSRFLIKSPVVDESLSSTTNVLFLRRIYLLLNCSFYLYMPCSASIFPLLFSKAFHNWNAADESLAPPSETWSKLVKDWLDAEEVFNFYLNLFRSQDLLDNYVLAIFDDFPVILWHLLQQELFESIFYNYKML